GARAGPHARRAPRGIVAQGARCRRAARAGAPSSIARAQAVVVSVPRARGCARMNPAHEARAGFWATFSAFFLWGLFPLYWHELRMVPAGQIVAHRILWCTLLVGGYLSLR